MAKKIQKLLIANRGEIACRIITACKSLGIATVAVYSEADRDARHVQLADEAVLIGPGPSNESYIVIEKVLLAAQTVKADAVHPGYGFLSERSQFAKAVQEAGLIWIGPSPEIIELMGNKISAKKAAEKAGVPTLPWGLVNLVQVEAAAKKVGYPLLLKAAAGGGGRGMRVVHEAKDLKSAAEAASREALSFFGSDEIFLEAYREKARHVEVQIFGDSHGQVMVFGERDCSAQRRHQKVIEEAPAFGISEKTRALLWKASHDLAKSVGYENAGTVEYLVDDQENVYFLEMNTRLQVEHPVSEKVWGVDLVHLQLKIAEGEKIPEEVFQLKPRGHSIEARIYVENPEKNFLPSPGKIKKIEFPLFSNLRVDTGYETGHEVPVFYDGMIAKMISWGETREEARKLLVAAINKTTLEGPAWNGPFLVDILDHPDFIKSKIFTKWIEKEFQNWKYPKFTLKTKKAEATTQGVGMTDEISPWIFFGKNKEKLKNFTFSAEQNLDEDSVDATLNEGPLVAEHPGKVLAIKCQPGQKVKTGDVLVVCESMKMEFNFSAPKDTIVKNILVKVGQVISAGTVLVEWGEE